MILCARFVAELLGWVRGIPLNLVLVAAKNIIVRASVKYD